MGRLGDGTAGTVALASPLPAWAHCLTGPLSLSTFCRSQILKVMGKSDWASGPFVAVTWEASERWKMRGFKTCFMWPQISYLPSLSPNDLVCQMKIIKPPSQGGLL